jgi:SNF2 family DNA or RNA helicase
MSVEKARSQLIELETTAQELRDKLDEARKLYQASIDAIVESETQAQQTRKDIETARTRLAHEEQIEATRERVQEMDEDLDKLVSKFESIASDKLWYVGTGNDDAILDHQWTGCMFGAVAERWILGDGVGLGKTRTTVAWLDLVGAKKVIIVCEANICNQFAGEVMELAPHRKLFNLYKKRTQQNKGIKRSVVDMRHAMLDEILASDEAVVVVNYEIWRRDKDVLAKLIMWHADTVIVDEAHNLKSTSTANFGYVNMLISMDNVCPKCKGDIKGLWSVDERKRKTPKPCEHCGWKIGDPVPVHAKNKLAEKLQSRSVKNVCFTTGTPILNSPLDLFALLHLCNPVMWPTMAAFKRLYLTNNYHSGHWDFSRGALDQMRPLIEGIFLARTQEDAGVVLPEQTHETVPVTLDKLEYPKQWKAIRQLSDAAQLILESGEAMTVMHIIALITRKRQANVDPSGIIVRDDEGNIVFDASEIDESVKIDVMVDNILSNHAEGRRQIVFSQFKHALKKVEERLAALGIRVARFDGDTPAKLRTEIKADFAKEIPNPKWDVVCMNYRTGGTGINLVGASVTHILDEEWNPGRRNQAYGRTHRMGQTSESKVFVYRIPGTIDTWQANLIQGKEDMIQGFNGVTVASPELGTDLLRSIKSGEIL